MDQTITCPSCSQPLVVAADTAGQSVQCPKCSTTFTVPGGAAAGAGGLLAPRKQGMAITSLVLGILSTFCLSIFGGIPAIILGHIARGKAKKQPDQYGGAGMALAGIILGYVSIVIFVIYLIFMFSIVRSPDFKAAIQQAQQQAQQIQAQQLPAQGALNTSGQDDANVIHSINNLKQIGLAFRIWEGDNNDQFPWNVSRAQGGTREVCRLDANGYELNPVPTFMVASNELSSPKILVCPNDPNKQAAADFASLTTDNISYLLRTGPNINDSHPQEILMVDTINGLVLRCDGSVQRDLSYKK
jgi:TM2 domain-containing membrane protein YozV